MQLRNARLCLDCEEIHDGIQCPSCASETFVFIKRWVPAPERRTTPRAMGASSPETLETYREMLSSERKQPTTWGRLVRGGAISLAMIGLAGWMLRRNTLSQDKTQTLPSEGGETNPPSPFETHPQRQERV